MASGVQLAPDVKVKYDEIKSKKIHRYMILEIKEGRICIEKIGSKDTNYADFLEDIMACGPQDCRYGVFDYPYEHKCEGTSSAPKQKLLLMSWCPDTATIKKKMVYASSLEVMKKLCAGNITHVQATDTSEAAAEEVEEKLRKNDRM